MTFSTNFPTVKPWTKIEKTTTRYVITRNKSRCIASVKPKAKAIPATDSVAEPKLEAKPDSKVEKISDTEYDIILIGVIDEEWHVFSQFTSEDGSLPSVLTFENTNDNYELVGKSKESESVKVYSDIFEVEETYFLDKVQF